MSGQKFHILDGEKRDVLLPDVKRRSFKSNYKIIEL